MPNSSVILRRNEVEEKDLKKWQIEDHLKSYIMST